MVKRPLLLLVVVALAGSGVGCSKQTPAQSAAEAQKNFQDQQRKKLIKVYEDLIKKYPDSPNVGKAQDRLRILREQAGIQAATPAKK